MAAAQWLNVSTPLVVTAASAHQATGGMAQIAWVMDRIFFLDLTWRSAHSGMFALEQTISY